MCGIVAYTGLNPATPYLLEGLKHLEYRGYDSAGIALANEGGPIRLRSVGTVDTFRAQVDSTLPHRAGIAHTRWATHGGVTEPNAHPHADCTGRVHVVHNGILENSDALRAELIEKGHRFTSETDTEVIAHLAEKFSRGLVLQPLVLAGIGRALLRQLNGAFAAVLQFADRPNLLLAVKRSGPLVVGIAEHGRFLASDPTAFAETTRSVIHLPDECYALLAPTDLCVYTAEGERLALEPEQLPDDTVRADRGSYEYFMLKEIHEQPTALAQTLEDRLHPGSALVLPGARGTVPELSPDRFDRIILVACGTSFHAGLIGERLLGKLWNIPTVCRLGSEARYSPWEFTPRTLAIFLSQSGETEDTAGALTLAKERGATTLGIVNEVQTRIGRTVDRLLPLRVGPERSVASTKAFTAQVAALSLLALHTAPDMLGPGGENLRRALRRLPDQVRRTLQLEAEVRRLAAEMTRYHHALYLGRGYNLATALEGALKLKEVSYIHAEGMTSAEMKHGTIALIDEEMPVVVVAPLDNDEFAIEKILSNVREVHARSSNITVVVSNGDKRFDPYARHLLRIPRAPAHLTPVLAAVVLQLLAYHVAVLRGLNPDQPRHLAKAVTVE